MNKVLSLFILILLTAFAVLGCSEKQKSNEKPEEEEQVHKEPQPKKKDITYTKDTLPIFKNRCSACHNDKAMPKKNWEKYNIAYEYRHNIKANVAINRTMPPGNSTKMTEEERDLIKDWVDQGAKK